MNYLKNLAKQTLAGVIAVALVAAAVSLAAPKAVHAAVAALIVQVANTSANPVPTTDGSLSAAHLITLYCPGSDAYYYQNGSCFQVHPGGAYNPNEIYTVPAGENLVVTDLEISSIGGGGSGFFYITNSTQAPLSIPQPFQVPDDGVTHVFTLSHGIVLTSGMTVPSYGQFNQAFLQGYLTAN